MPHAPVSRAAAALLAALCALAGPAAAEVLKVPQDYTSIQDALDAAAPGDVVKVGPGVYREALQVLVEDLVLEGSGATLDGEFAAPCVTIAANGVTLDGLTLINGGDPDGTSAAVSASGDLLVLRRLTVRGAAGPGLEVAGDNPVLEDNDLQGCAGPAIAFSGVQTTSLASIRRNEIRACGAGVVASQGQLQVERNRLSDLTGTALDLDPANFATASNVAAQVNDNLIERVAGFGLDLDTGASGAVLVNRNRVSDVTLGGLDVQATGGGEIDATGNRIDGCGGDGLRTRGTGAHFVARNRIQATGGRGLAVELTGGAGGLIERNRVRDTNGHGLQVSGQNATLLRNRVQQAAGVGLACTGNTAELRRNQVWDAGRQGLVLSGNDGVIERCVVRGAAFDGLLLTGNRNEVLDSRFQDNGGDGIDLQELSLFFVDDADNVLRGNRCTGNAHEGIDNSAFDTVIEFNTVAQNGGAFGPDIAGAGNDVTGDDVPDGTVASFEGNKVPPASGSKVPGSSTTPQRLDLGEQLP